MQRRIIFATALQALAAGCMQKEVFVVLPNADGRPGSGAISVADGNTTTTLDQAYAAAQTRNDAATTQPLDIGNGNAYAVFNQAITARPVLPHRFQLYFFSGSDAMTPDSATAYQGVVDDVHARKAYEIQVVGHADTVGNLDYNQDLSVTRAIAVRDRLVADGISADAIAVSGRGELDPLVPTADQVDEAKNRYVDILIR
jgi:outer membrane protein OmpA-like peptidoglycan-associated protein